MKRNTRKALSRVWSVISLSVLTLGLVASPVLSLVAKADSGAADHLIINEINWAGTQTDPSINEQWIELQNPTASAITGNYRLEVPYGEGSTIIANLNAINVPAGGYLLVGSDTINSIKITADYNYVMGFDASLSSADYIDLTNADTDTVTDRVKNGLAGSNCVKTFEGCYSSTMARYDNNIDGTAIDSWYTSRTIGTNVKAGVNLFGTPANSTTAPIAAYSNRELPIPEQDQVWLDQPTQSVLDTPTVSGTFAISFPATKLDVNFYSKGNVVTPFLTLSNVDIDAERNFEAVVSAANALPAGHYVVTIQSKDNFGNLSEEQNYIEFTIVKSTISIDEFPTNTNLSEITITGKVNEGTNTVFVKTEGLLTATIPVPAGSTSFEAKLTLANEGVNNFSFQSLSGVNNLSEIVSISINKDSVAPGALDLTKIILHANNPGTPDQIEGLLGSSPETGIYLVVFSDAQLLNPIGQAVIKADGSFDLTNIGDNQYARVYLALKDLAGNIGPSTYLDNPISFVNSNISISSTASDITTDSVVISWTPVPGAVSYQLKYKTSDGTYSAPINLCNSGTCTYSSKLIGLIENTTYIYAISAIDQYGNQTGSSEFSFQTKKLEVALTTTETPVAATTDRSLVTPYSAAPTAVTESTPEPVATTTNEETGDVKSTTTDETESSRNWTPWIILAVLIALAILATTGYFYWFGGEAGQLAMESVAKEKEKEGAKNAPNTGKSDIPEVGKEKVIYNNKKNDRRW